jgi:hypothetical protein
MHNLRWRRSSGDRDQNWFGWARYELFKYKS